MLGQRVVITGMGAVSPYGEGVDALAEGLHAGRCALTPLPLLPEHHEQTGAGNSPMGGVDCHVAGRVPEFNAKRIPRELRRAMSPMSIYACLAAWEALAQAGLCPDGGRRMGVAVGSTLGSPHTLHEFFAEFLRENSVEGVRSSVFFKIMSHTVASNVALACRCEGRVLAPSAACASGLMSMGLGYECIAAGREHIMLCGGADEFHLLTAATFDRLGAATHATDPLLASRPFDCARDGIVCGEGAGMLVLESLESAEARHAPILAEIRGFAARSSPNIAQPDREAVLDCMREALDDAGLKPDDLGAVSAHATSTLQGDEAEGRAIAALVGTRVPVASLKGHMGHCMAACGALEGIACVHMLRQNIFWPTLGLVTPDPACGTLAHPTRPQPLASLAGRPAPLLKNCFALGGPTCSMVFTNFYA